MNRWTLWSKQPPTDAKLVYRWRIPAQKILGLVMQPEWSDKIFSFPCKPDIYCAKWEELAYPQWAGMARCVAG